MNEIFEKIEKKRAYAREYARKRRLDPEFRAKEAARIKARYDSKLKHDPEWVAKRNTQNLLDYHTKIKTSKDKFELRRIKVKGYQAKRRLKFQETKYHLQTLLGNKCIDCGLNDPRLLDFDHIDPKTKCLMLSQSWHLPIEILELEVKKCELRCPNCHRIKTLNNNDYDSYRNREYRNEQRSFFKRLPIEES